MLRQEPEGKVTQGEAECFDRSNRVLPGEPASNEGHLPYSVESSERATSAMNMGGVPSATPGSKKRGEMALSLSKGRKVF
jgi:hypothetical protein